MAHSINQGGYGAVRRCGLTVIELLVIITALSMAAVFAVPHFRSLEVQSRDQDSQALARRVETAAQLTHGMWLSQGRPDFVVYEGKSVELVHGFPSESAIVGMLQQKPRFDFAAGRWIHTEAGDPSRCGVIYRPPAFANDDPTVKTLTEGC